MKRFLSFIVFLSSVSFAFGADAVRPHAGMLRYPDVSASHIAFVYANDLWVVPREGGVASPLASPPGAERFPRFSPSGQSIAFVGNYDGDRDIYTVSIDGGAPLRITHNPANEMMCDWTPQNRLLFFSNALAGLGRQEQLFLAHPKGGMPEKLPVPYGANGAIDFSGEWLAYTPFTRDFRTWKRYRGGWATDIWLFNLNDFSSEKITDWEGTDTYPMWYGDKLFYLSDAGPNHRLNIWMFNRTIRERRQITFFKDYDCKFPAVGPGESGEGEIVFQNGANLYLLNLSTEQSRSVIVTIPGDRPKIRPQRIQTNDRISGSGVSSTGKRAVVEARGDIWTLPAKDGSVLNLTRTDDAAERDPSWSPDGRWIAYFSDATGEYELYIRQSDGKDEVKQLTSGGNAFRYSPVWSPDSKKIAFSDKTGSLFIHFIDEKETRFVNQDMWASRPGVSWSHDSSWLAYNRNGENRMSSIWLYNLEEEKNHQVTSDLFDDGSPTFDRKGDFLFFTSNRQFTNMIFDEPGWTYIYADTGVLLAVPLRKDVKNPFLAKNDVEEWKKEESSDDKDGGDKDKGDKEKKKDKEKAKDKESGDCDKCEKKDDDSPCDSCEKKECKTDKKSDAEEKKEDGNKDEGDKDEEKPLQIDIEGFEARAFQIPVGDGRFYNLAVNDGGKLIYAHGGLKANGGKTDIKLFDLNDEKKEEKTVLSGMGGFDLSADGKKLMVRRGSSFYIVDAAPGQKLENGISTNDLVATVSPPHEWKQMFNEGWRIMRDFFYDPNMHGVDWKAMRERYAAMLDDCASREDLNFVIDELIAELNVGHAYNRGNPDLEDQPSESVGLLGVDFELCDGAYKVAKIYRGAPWDVDARSPLDVLEPGQLEEGDYILAVNREPIDVSKDPWAAFVGLANKTVTLTVGDGPKIDGDSRDVVVKTISSESDLRYRAWIERNRDYVDKKTGGKVGYIYVPNTSSQGNNDLFRQYYGQLGKEALIIDERWNGGGYIPSYMIHTLNRPVLNYWARRDGKDWPELRDAFPGPKCMLINSLSASGGDAFPSYFRQLGLGKLIGTRTWGGLVGITGGPSLIDGGRVIAPSFAFYNLDGTWGIEGHGVDPDIEVIDDPTKMANGGDPQLDAAVEQMLHEIKTNPYIPPKRPAYPDRSGMGIREEDK